MENKKGLSEKDVAKLLGRQVYEKRMLTCPVCAEPSEPEIQPLSSFGEERDILFCPHCDLTVLLKVEF